MDTRVTYPRLLRRVQAILIDSLVVIGILALSLFLLIHFSIENTFLKLIALVFPILLYEPLLVSFTGGTLGHHILKIRVRSVKNDKNINIFYSFLRFLIKALLGWASLIIVLITRRHQAVHDLISRSIIVNKYPDTLPSFEALAERIYDRENYIYPSKIKRVIFILLYTLVSLLTVSYIYVFLISTSCLRGAKCSMIEQILGATLNYSMFFILAALIVFGWRGELYGCKKKKIQNPNRE